jgi:hypothetical protein
MAHMHGHAVGELDRLSQGLAVRPNPIEIPLSRLFQHETNIQRRNRQAKVSKKRSTARAFSKPPH